jgi:hypothetical protein
MLEEAGSLGRVWPRQRQKGGEANKVGQECRGKTDPKGMSPDPEPELWSMWTEKIWLWPKKPLPWKIVAALLVLAWILG